MEYKTSQIKPNIYLHVRALSPNTNFNIIQRMYEDEMTISYETRVRNLFLFVIRNEKIFLIVLHIQ